MSQATVYVGLRENPSFIGPEPLGELAAVIARSEGRKSISTSHRAEQLKLTRRAMAHLQPQARMQTISSSCIAPSST